VKLIVRRVPPGGRVADAVVEQEIELDHRYDAYHRIDSIKEESRKGTEIGVLLFDLDGEQYGAWTIQNAPDLPGTKPSAGYPHHGCGSPLVPGDVLGLKPPTTGQLLCVGCQDWVSAPATIRMQAQQAAKAERGSR